MISQVLPLLLTFAGSVIFCGIYLYLARRWQILDIPNGRSSHKMPTPRGGGLPLLLAFFLGVIWVFGFSAFWASPYSPALGGALFLVLLGASDDQWELSVSLRFFSYGFCCVIAASLLLRGGLTVPSLPLVFGAAFAMLWALNLYNFMDGVDGLAATQCFLACGGAACLAWGEGANSSYSVFCLLLGVSHLGFLVWNWPVAKLFMGDAGSIPTGFLLVALAMLGATQGNLAIACWLVLLAVFITDASWTLLWRVLTGQKFTQAHRNHAYQRLSRHWGSHQPVVIMLIVINGLWLFPIAWSVAEWPQYSGILVILAYLPLLLGMVKIRNLA